VSDFAPQQEAGFWAMRLMDLPLFVMLAVFILVVSLRFRPPPAVQLMLYLHAALPFFLNGLLFPVSYMPDQLKYLSAFYEIRTGALSVWEVILHGGNVDRASLLFAAMPLPFALTPNSLGFITDLSGPLFSSGSTAKAYSPICPCGFICCTPAWPYIARYRYEILSSLLL